MRIRIAFLLRSGGAELKSTTRPRATVWTISLLCI
jgi:hypothetical protein